MRRINQIGRHQGRVLMALMAAYPRPVDARWLAYLANPAGDQTQGNRVLATLEDRALIARDSIGNSVDKRVHLKWRITFLGCVAWIEWLPSFVDSVPTEGM